MEFSSGRETETEYNKDSEQEERLSVFLESFGADNPPFLHALEKQALQEGVPIIRMGSQNLIRFLMRLTGPKRILEVGAGVGFSSIFMMTWLGQQAGTDPENTEARVTTIELDHERALKAAANVEKAGFAGKIEVLEGDAAKRLPELAEQNRQYDLVFMDAAKGQYIEYLPYVRRLLRPEGILLSDNILKEGEILESRYAVTRRNRTIHRRMREYLKVLCGEGWETVLLSSGDGAALSIRLEDK